MSRSDIESRMDDREEQKRFEADNRREQSLMLAVAMGKRLTDDDLQFLFQRATRRVIDQGHYQHIGSGKIFKVDGVALDHADMSPVVRYYQWGGVNSSVCFSRPLQDFLDKFQHVVERKLWTHAETGAVVGEGAAA